MEEGSKNHLVSESPGEEAASVLLCRDQHKKLESAVFNSVSLGQWESARACLRCLALSGDKKVCDSTRELLKVLILDASNYWNESSGIPSPHHLSWLALDAYKSFFQDDDNLRLPDYIGVMIEFRLLLYQVRGMLSFSTRVANHLCHYHSTHVLQIPGTSYDTVPPFQSVLLAFLHDVITMQDPALGHALIKHLTVSSSSSSSSSITVSAQHVSNNESLQCVYLDCISECLEALDALKALVAHEGGEDSDSQYESDHTSSSTAAARGRSTTGRFEKVVSMIYTLLSMVEAQPGMIRLTKKIDSLFATLLQASYPMAAKQSAGQDKADPVVVTFEPGRIYACLLGRSNGFLINRLYEVEDYLRRKRVAEESPFVVPPQARYGSLPKLGEHKNEGSGDAGEDSGNSSCTKGIQTGQSPVDTSKDEWKDRFYGAMYENKHLLESVLERGLQLICTGHLQEVARLMDRIEFIPLRPVLLLLGWDRYSAVGSGKELLDALWPMEVSMKQSLLYSGCCKMAFQVELVQWCLDKAQPQVHRCAGDMFKGLKSHSTLYVLHHSTPLASLDPMEVVDILKMRPRVPSRSTLMSPPPQFSRGVTPMKPNAGDSEPSRALSPMLTLTGGGGMSASSHSRMLPPTLKPEQERDISIFRSFCALKLVLDAVWNSVLLRDGMVPPSQETRARQSAKTDLTASDELTTSTTDSSVSNKSAPLSKKHGSSKAARKLELGSEELNSTIIAEESFVPLGFAEDFSQAGNKQAVLAQHYKWSVTDLLQEAKLYLTHIYPLTYRLEILEDIFSILFLTSGSVRPIKSATSADQDENFDGNPATLSYGSGSMSSFIALLRGRNEFLMDEKLVSELLAVLQDCIQELRSAKYALQQSDGSSGEGTSLTFDGVQSSISEGSLNARLTRLEQYVTEAKWRHQMVLSEENMGSPLLSGSKMSSLKGEGRIGAVGRHGPHSSLTDEDSDSGWATESEEEKEEKEAEHGNSGKEKPTRRKKKGSLVSSLELKDAEVESVGSRSTADSLHLQRPLSRGSSVSSHPSRGRKSQSPAPRPPSAISTPAPRPSGFGTSNQSRGSPTAQRPVLKQGSSSSLSNVSKSGTLESKGAGSAKSKYHLDNKQGASLADKEDSGEYADVEERSPRMSSNRKRKRKRTRSQSSHFAANRKRRLQVSEQSSEPKPSRNSIVSRMLSSAGSLLRVCLRHSNYMKAGEVVQTLHMEGKFGEAIIQFSEQFEQVGRELSQQSCMSTPTRTKCSSCDSSISSSHLHSTNLSRSGTPPQPSSSPKPSFSHSAGSQTSSSHPLTQGYNLFSMNLQVAIMNARSSYDPLQSLHQLLAPPTIHQMLFSGDAELEWTAGEHEGLFHLTKHVPSLIMLDMVCGQRIGGATALKIVEMAMDRLGNALSAVQEMGGPFALLKLISEASVHFSQSSGFSLPAYQVPAPYSSPHALLTATAHALTPYAISLTKTFSDVYREARKKLEEEIEASLAEISSSGEGGSTDVFTQLSQLATTEENAGSGGSSSSSSSNTVTSPLRQQTPPMGSIFDELVRALHSVPPLHCVYSEGVVARGDKGFSRQVGSPGVASSTASYLWQFSHYIRKFIELLVKCLGIKALNMNKGSLVLSVMKETPYRMLGCLIFERGIPPQKLEAMMNDFPHLQIVAILVKCCCPDVSSRGVVLKTDAVPQPVPVLALNQGEATSFVGDPCNLSYKLLSQLLNILKDRSASTHSQESLLLPGDLAVLYNNPDVREVLEKTPSLASVDLTLLRSLKKQMVFYTNVLNLLYLHALMFYCSSLDTSTAAPEGVDLGMGVALPRSLRGITLPMLESSRVVQLALFGKVGYHLGQLGLVSCLDLHYSVLCRGLTPPTVIQDTGIRLRLPLRHPDPWLAHAPTNPDARLFYAIHNGQLGCFPPIPFTVEKFDSSLATCEQRYITANVSIEHGRRMVTVASDLVERRNDFDKSGVHASETQPTVSTHSHALDMALFRYLQEHLEPTMADILRTMIEMWEASKGKRIHLSVQQTDCKLGYSLGSAEGGLSLSRSVVSPRISPTLRRRRLPRESSRKDIQATSLPSVKEYSLTPEMMDFVKKQKPLLAGVIALVCPPTRTLSGSRSGGTIDEEAAGGEIGWDTPLAKEREKEESKSFIKSLRIKMVSPSVVVPLSTTTNTSIASSAPVSPIRALTFPKIPGISDHREAALNASPWQRHYNEILAYFPSGSPMRKYLEVRVLPFEKSISWVTDFSGQQKQKQHQHQQQQAPASSDSAIPLEKSRLSVSSLALAPPGSKLLEEACMYVMKTLVEKGDVASAIQFLTSEPAVGSSQVHALSHMALSCHFIANFLELSPQDGQRVQSSLDKGGGISISRRPSMGELALMPVNPIPVLSQLSDPEYASRLTIASLDVWSVDVCVGMLEFCLHHLPSHSPLATPLTEKLEKMRVYSRIMTACEKFVHSHSKHRSVRSCPWKNWNELASDSESKTSFVLGRLLDAKEFSLAREWCAVHSLSGSVTRQIEVEYLFNLLEGEDPNPIVAHQKLDSLPDERTSLEVCEALLQEKDLQQKTKKVTTKTDLNTMVFVLQYMLTRLSVSLANKPEYSCKLMGAKALLCLPQDVYSNYSCFISVPLLLVEQLIMDLKIDWAASVIKELRSISLLHVLSTDDTPSVISNIMKEEEESGRCSADPFSRALMFYCTKALDFHETILTTSTPASSVVASVASTEPATPTLYSSSHRYTQAGRLGSGGHARRLSQDQFPPATPRVPIVTNRSTSLTGMFPSDLASEIFQPPPEPPPRDRWEKDVDAKMCRICRGQFGMFMRRHHCRRCGRVVCATCSSHTSQLKGYSRPVRTCDSCHQLFSLPSSSDTSSQQYEGVAARDRAEGGAAGGQQADGLCGEGFPALQTRLEPSDKMANENLRSEFYYERTPNTALCLSLADMLMDKELVARLILDCCHAVSAKLVPDSQGCVNAELDHHFVINLIQNLLLNAKLRYADANLSSGVELCDNYLSRVDLLRLLVTSRYNKIPSLQELTKPDLARRVRDRLIQDDRFSLAMEVSTKCNLDTVAVWSAWGLALLKCGEFPEARTKLQKCFKVSSQSGSSGQNSHLIQRILEQIEQKPLSVASRHTRLSEDWLGVVMGSTAITQRSSDECAMDQARFKECIFYLTTYASHSHTVSFLVRHMSWVRVCRYIIEKNCSSDVFVENLWIPVLKSGQVDEVMVSMKEIDPSLGVWEPHLTAACLFFTRKSLFSVLFTTQLFMNDYVRAGLTCVKFFVGFSGRSTTIEDLFDRLHHLDQAVKYLQVARDKAMATDRGRGSMKARVQRVFEDTATAGGPKGGSSPGVRSMSTSELNNHLETIKLQKDVVKHLQFSAREMGTLREPLGGGNAPDLKSSQAGAGRMALSPPPSTSSPSSSAHQPPTLFGNSRTRGEVATMVITGSRDLETGFNLTLRIIEHYKMNMRQVFCETAHGLALKHRYGEVRLLLQCIQVHCQSKTVNMDAMNDDIVMAAVKELAKQTRDGKQVDKLVGLLIHERNRIKAFVQCGKLKSAYLAAVRAKLADEVQKISEIANKAGQLSVRDICDKWLQANAPYLLNQK